MEGDTLRSILTSPGTIFKNHGQICEIERIANKLKVAHEAATKAHDEQLISLVELRQDYVEALVFDRPAAKAAPLKHPGRELASRIHRVQHNRHVCEEVMTETLQATRTLKRICKMQNILG